jgi:3-oxoacyl-[acyl-carrier-protein] synthase II
MKNRVVITGTGFVLQNCSSLEEIFSKVTTGKGQFELFSTRNGSCYPVAPIQNFDLKDSVGRCKNKRYLGRAGLFGLSSAVDAVRDSGLEFYQIEKLGLFSGAGPNLDFDYSDERNRALWLLHYLPNTMNSVISSQLGIHGPAMTLGNACAASLHAVGEAFLKIVYGQLDFALAGGADSRISDYGISGYADAGALYSRKDQGKNYFPLTTMPCGFIPGEGGAFFVLESEESAKDRGAKIYAEVAGFSASSDGFNMTAPEPEGKFAQEAVSGALKMSGLSADEIDFVSAHGTGTILNDKMEQELILRMFGASDPDIFAFKTYFGHLASGCGAAELASALSLFLFSNEGYESAVLQNFGFGGQNAALVIKRYR